MNVCSKRFCEWIVFTIQWIIITIWLSFKVHFRFSPAHLASTQRIRIWRSFRCTLHASVRSAEDNFAWLDWLTLNDRFSLSFFDCCILASTQHTSVRAKLAKAFEWHLHDRHGTNIVIICYRTSSRMQKHRTHDISRFSVFILISRLKCCSLCSVSIALRVECALFMIFFMPTLLTIRIVNFSGGLLITSDSKIVDYYFCSEQQWFGRLACIHVTQTRFGKEIRTNADQEQNEFQLGVRVVGNRRCHRILILRKLLNATGLLFTSVPHPCFHMNTSTTIATSRINSIIFANRFIAIGPPQSSVTEMEIQIVFTIYIPFFSLSTLRTKQLTSVVRCDIRHNINIYK